MGDVWDHVQISSALWSLILGDSLFIYYAGFASCGDVIFLVICLLWFSCFFDNV